MHQISLVISSLLAQLFYAVAVPATVIRTEEKLDPRGLVMHDVAYMEKHLPQVHYKAGYTLDQVAYQQGQHDLLAFIKREIIGRGTHL